LGVFALQSDQFGHGIAPALWSAAAIGVSTVADSRSAGMACGFRRSRPGLRDDVARIRRLAGMHIVRVG
jgi:hypothetical protein